MSRVTVQGKGGNRCLFARWADLKGPDLNRILKPYGVRLVVKSSRQWGEQVAVTAHPLVKRVAVQKYEPAPQVKPILTEAAQ